MDILLELGIHFFAGFNNGSQITGLQGKGGGGISLGPHYYFQPHHRRLDISQVITAEGSPLHYCRGLTSGFIFLQASTMVHKLQDCRGKEGEAFL